MRGRIIGAALFALSTGAMAAAPQDQPAEEQSVQDESSPEQSAQEQATPERKICRTSQITGSLTRRSRICLTETQWREVHDRTRRGLDDFTRGASGGCRAPNNPAAGTMCGG